MITFFSTDADPGLSERARTFLAFSISSLLLSFLTPDILTSMLIAAGIGVTFLLLNMTTLIWNLSTRHHDSIETTFSQGLDIIAASLFGRADIDGIHLETQPQDDTPFLPFAKQGIEIQIHTAAGWELFTPPTQTRKQLNALFTKKLGLIKALSIKSGRFFMRWDSTKGSKHDQLAFQAALANHTLPDTPKIKGQR